MFSERAFLSPYIIAEIGVNHAGDIELAKKLIIDAAEGGASCAKFQAYKAHMIAAKESPSYWDLKEEPTTSQYELFKKYDSFNLKEYKELADLCSKSNIDFMVTAFDLDFCRELNELVNVHKIASADITNLPLLREIASYNKPVLFSCGASTLEEIKNAKDILLRNGAKDAIPLHCVLNYPTPPSNARLSFIQTLQESLKCEVGYSDHTIPTEDCLAQVLPTLFGCLILEKHFTHDKTLKGNDHYHAFDKSDLMHFKNILKKLKDLYGEKTIDNQYNQTLAIKNARRSLYFSRNLKEGTVINKLDLVAKRPGEGVSPMLIDDFIGKCLRNDVKIDDLVKFSDFN